MTFDPGQSPGVAASRSGGRVSLKGERRVVTVLFCDVADSTAMAKELDPEEWAEIMNEAFEYMTQPVKRYDGIVARLMGDAILAFFGAPDAHEDDPQRAVMAGLDILEGIRPFREQMRDEYSLDFNVRVGINTGPVVVGEVGSEVAGEYTAMGDAVNLAARMEQTAAPGVVQVSSDTHKLVAPLFDFESLGPIDVKGKDEPVEAYRAIGRKSDPGRLRGIEGLGGPLIGRTAEVDALTEVSAEVRQGRSGRIVSLLGEAGLGKSRMLEELRSTWQDDSGDDLTWVECRGVSFDATRPYGLFLQQLRELSGAGPNDSPEAVRRRIEDGDGLPEGRRESLKRVADVLLATESATNGHQLTGEAVKHEVYEAITELWRGLSATSPVAMALDDLHWTDPASVDLLLHLFELTEEAPVLFICAFRPERRSPAWSVKQTAEAEWPHRYTEIALKPLSTEESHSLVDSLLVISELPEDLRQLIFQKAEGNPFFVEEVVRTLIDSGSLTRDESGERWMAAVEVEEIEIPDNLQGLLISRLDRLGEEARLTLQIASVIGRAFYYQILSKVADAAIALDKQLATLQRFELISETARSPLLEYAFRHELTREAAYQSVLRRRCRVLHRQVGEAIETLFPDQLEEHAHRLAYHFDEARARERALRYYTMAGDAAGRLYANTEAIAHYTKAIELARASDAPGEQLSYLYGARGKAMELSGLYDQALENYEELERLGTDSGQTPLELAALASQATLHSTYTPKFDPERGKALSNRCITLARDLKDQRAEAKALWNLMLSEFFGGRNISKAIEYGESSLAIARENDLTEEIAYTLHDLARAYRRGGQLQSARSAQEESATMWREMGNLPMLADSLSSLAAPNYFETARLDKAMAAAKEALEISRSIGNAWGEGGSLFAMGPVYLELGELGETVNAIQQSLLLAEKSAMQFIPAFAGSFIGMVHGVAGDPRGGIELARGPASSPDQPPELREFSVGVLAQLLLLDGQLEPAQEALKEIDAQPDPAKPPEWFGHMGSHIISRVIAPSEIWLALGKYDDVSTLADTVMAAMREKELRIYQPDVLRFKAAALAGLDRVDEAYRVLLEARAEAQAQGSRRALWPVLSRLIEIESRLGNEEALYELRAAAREVATYIGDHAGELKESFLSQPDVKAVLEPVS